MEMERTANIAFMVMLLIPFALLLAFLNLMVIREGNFARRRDPGTFRVIKGRKKSTASVRPLYAGKSGQRDEKKSAKSNVRPLYLQKGRPQNGKKTLFR